MIKNRDWHKDYSEIPGLQKAGHRHRDSGVASPRFLHINTEKNLCLYLLFISYPLCLSNILNLCVFIAKQHKHCI